MEIKTILPEKFDTPDLHSGWQQKRQDIKNRFLENISAPPFPRNTHDIKTIETVDCGAYLRHKLSYIVGGDDVIPAYLMVPASVQPGSPAVVAIHQTNKCGKDEAAGLRGSKDYAYGHELALRGYVVLAPDCLAAGERVFPGKEDFNSMPFYEKYPDWSMVGKGIEDTMSAVDVLHTLDYVDPDKIGIIGHSHGGFSAIAAMAMDERIAAGVSNCGMSVISVEDQRLEWSTEDGYIYFPKLRPLLLAGKELPFDLNEVAALIAPRAWCNISAYDDKTMGNQEFLADVGVQLNQVYKLFGREDHFCFCMHGNNHSFPEYARSLAYDWLDRFLKSRQI